jgi:hypothetical protein
MNSKKKPQKKKRGRMKCQDFDCFGGGFDTDFHVQGSPEPGVRIYIGLDRT